MAAPEFIDTLLLLALPASGKSEVRRFLLHAPLEQRIRQYHVADTVQLDDFPYVHYFRCIDEALVERGEPAVFFKGERDGFANPMDWGTLLHLVNDDYLVMKDPEAPTPLPDAALLFQRIDFARAKVGAPPVFTSMDSPLRDDLAAALQEETRRLVEELFGSRPERIDDKTLVIEFARGGPEGHPMPLVKPHGYAWNLAQLAPAMLERAAILYIWVTPEESRRKNIARADPDDPGSILAHSAPESVMRGDYGCDDIEYLMQQSDRPDTIRIEARGRTFYLPIARFDNRVDRTTFLRDDPDTWSEEDVRALHDELAGPLDRLWRAYLALHGS